MTTKDVVKLLPLDEPLKLEILNLFDYLTPAQRLSIERIAWNTYYALFHERLEENMQLQYARIIDGEEEFGDDFQARAAKKAREDLTNELEKSSTSVDLAAARKAMEQILSEIKSVKKTK